MTAERTRVLLVEDEAFIAMVVECYLEELGCDVVATASRLEDGLQKAADLQIDVALLDVNLAGKLSYPIAEMLNSRSIPFIFSTGYGFSALPKTFSGTPVLPKPFEKATLALALTAVLERQTEARRQSLS